MLQLVLYRNILQYNLYRLLRLHLFESRHEKFKKYVNHTLAKLNVQMARYFYPFIFQNDQILQYLYMQGLQRQKISYYRQYI